MWSLSFLEYPERSEALFTLSFPSSFSFLLLLLLASSSVNFEAKRHVKTMQEGAKPTTEKKIILAGRDEGEQGSLTHDLV